MDEATRNEVLSRLDALAEKLGATGEYLWHELVQLQVAEGVSTLTVAVLALASSLGLFWYASARKRRLELLSEAATHLGRQYDILNEATGWNITRWIVLGFGLLITLPLMRSGIVNIIAPAGRAMMDIIN